MSDNAAPVAHAEPASEPAPAPRLRWAEAPRRTEWGAGMMEALIALGADETLLLYAHRDAVPMVDALLSAQPAPARVPLTTDALKPCPFCGSDDVEASDMEGKHYVVCYDCALEGPLHESRAAVVAAWNRRALAAPAVPPGWQLVPVEPTPAMLEAGLKRKALALWKDGASPLRASTANLRPVQEVAALQWAAMLAAAPTAQQEPARAEGE